MLQFIVIFIPKSSCKDSFYLNHLFIYRKTDVKSFTPVCYYFIVLLRSGTVNRKSNTRLSIEPPEMSPVCFFV